MVAVRWFVTASLVGIADVLSALIVVLVLAVVGFGSFSAVGAVLLLAIFVIPLAILMTSFFTLMASLLGWCLDSACARLGARNSWRLLLAIAATALTVPFFAAAWVGADLIVLIGGVANLVGGLVAVSATPLLSPAWWRWTSLAYLVSVLLIVALVPLGLPLMGAQLPMR